MKVGLEHEIDAQIIEVDEHLARAAASIQDDELSSALIFTGEACALLLKIVKDQQIEALRLRRDVDSIDKSVKSLCDIHP